MNARAIFDYCFGTSTSSPTRVKKEFPPEAYDYDSPIDKAAVASIQAQANKVLGKQQWTVIERLGDGHQ
jgi:hypothetical protein